MKLNLGSGTQTLPEFVNVDIADVPGVDVVHDLDAGPWPFEDECADEIVAKDVFEHVGDALLFVGECHRILVPGGHLHLRTPNFRSMDAFTDPTHRRFPTEHTFDYWIPGTTLYRLHNAAYGGQAFQKVSYRLELGSMEFQLRKIA